MSTQQSSLTQVVTVASVGGGLEMYDFSIYIFFAPIISTLFFPHENSTVAMLETLAVFAVGYFSRPLGAILFGHFGDKLGRKTGLLITIALMALSTTMIGLLPTYSTIGIAAPILLIIARFLQGISVGGDLPGAITFVEEYAHDHHRGSLCSLVFCGVNVGIVLASGIGALLTFFLTQQQLTTWGWRFAFILGLVIGFVGFYLRSKMQETPYFIRLQAAEAHAKIPVLQLFRENLKQILQGAGMAWLFAVVIAQIFLYMPTYLHTQSHLSLTTALITNSFNILLFSLCIPIAGYLSDKIGRKPVLLSAALLLAIFAYPLYLILNTANFMVTISALICLAILAAGVIGTVPCMLGELFPTKVRYTGVGVTYNISFAIFAGLTPVVATYLIYKLHDIQAPSFNLILSAIVAFIAALTIKEMSGKSLESIY